MTIIASCVVAYEPCVDGPSRLRVMRGAAQNPFPTTTPTRRRFGDNQIATLQTEEGRDRLADELAKQSTHPAQKNYLWGDKVAEVYRAIWRSLVKLFSFRSSRTLTLVVSLPNLNRLRTDDD
ncbi:hypothetical protein [Bradyrhizobium yuanmingense]|uniref:hypothetical protein n=1 Tax=Bradyrhizobium yuanmingense TaxID=108015 RepID=UPI0023B8D41D|nr:hypothetical protein [Bradyrhizobium yuanmingense]MDF0495325.1 hypothetical protein [Bradyrhizobium yuanmingense]